MENTDKPEDHKELPDTSNKQPEHAGHAHKQETHKQTHAEHSHPEHHHSEYAHKKEETPKENTKKTAHNEDIRLLIAILITAAVTAVIVGVIYNFAFKPRTNWQNMPQNGMNAANPGTNTAQNNILPGQSQPPAQAIDTKTYDLSLSGGRTVEFVYPENWSVNDSGSDITFTSADQKSTCHISKTDLENGNGVVVKSQSTSPGQNFSVNMTASGNKTVVNISNSPADTGLIYNNVNREMDYMLRERQRMNREMDNLFWQMHSY